MQHFVNPNALPVEAGPSGTRSKDATNHRQARTSLQQPRRILLGSRVRLVARALADESGSATAEYAVATMAAVGFAGLLVLILRGDEVRGILTDLVRRALTVAN